MIVVDVVDAAYNMYCSRFIPNLTMCVGKKNETVYLEIY